jgi:homogentisate solanesyltransferase
MLASTMAVIRALFDHPMKFKTSVFHNAILGLVALLCGNAYIVGINQIFDVDVDEVRFK